MHNVLMRRFFLGLVVLLVGTPYGVYAWVRTYGNVGGGYCVQQTTDGGYIVSGWIGETQKSHINMCVFDSTWEATEAFELDRNSNVEAWVKNDRLGFEVLYVFEGLIRKYRSDFIIRLVTGEYLVLETKGQDSQKDRTKRKFLDEWVKAVNQDGRFGKWRWAVSKNPADVASIIEKNLI